MRKLLFFTGVFLILISGIAAMCDEEMIKKIRDPNYFGVTEREATDEELKVFLKNQGNRDFIEGAIRQVTLGREIFSPSVGKSISAEEEFLKFMAKEGLAGTLKIISNSLKADYPFFGPLVTTIGTLTTVANGAKIFGELANALSEFDKRNILYFYKYERSHGASKEAALYHTVNDPSFKPVIDKILLLQEPWLLGASDVTREARLRELRQDFGKYCESVYQSWVLANTEEGQKRRNIIKDYILWWIKTYVRGEATIPTPTPKICIDRVPLTSSIQDPKGDTPFNFIDIVNARVKTQGEEVSAEIELASLPQQLTFNQTPDPRSEYEWGIFLDIDNNPNTGNSSGGAEYWLTVIHFSFPDDGIITGPLRDNVRIYVWKSVSKNQWKQEATAVLKLDNIRNVLTIQGRIPGLSSNARWWAKTYAWDPKFQEARVDRAPDPWSCR